MHFRKYYAAAEWLRYGPWLLELALLQFGHTPRGSPVKVALRRTMCESTMPVAGSAVYSSVRALAKVNHGGAGRVCSEKGVKFA